MTLGALPRKGLSSSLALFVLRPAHSVAAYDDASWNAILLFSLSRKGLSSSAALCVCVARAFSAAYGLGLTPEEEMEVAFLGERATPSLCGRWGEKALEKAIYVCMHFRYVYNSNLIGT